MPPTTTKPDQLPPFRLDEAGRYVIPSGTVVVLEPGVKVVLAGEQPDLPDLEVSGRNLWLAEQAGQRCNDIVALLRRIGVVPPDWRAEAEAKRAEEDRVQRDRAARQREAGRA